MSNVQSRSRDVLTATERVKWTCSEPEPHDSHQQYYEEDFSWAGYSTDSETYTPNSGGGKSQWKDFEHYKCSQLNQRTSETACTVARWGSPPHYHRTAWTNPIAGYRGFSWGSSNERFGSPGSLNSGLPALYSPQPDGHFVVAPGDLDSLIQRALSTMLPRIKAELSSLNSLYELKDFKSLPGMLKRAKGLISGISQRFPQIVKLGSLRNSTLKQMGRQSASWYLQWQFATAPLISDICGMYRVLSRTERRMNDLVTRAGKPQRHHFTWYVNEYTDRYDPPEGIGSPHFNVLNFHTDGYGNDRTVKYKPSLFHAEIEYCYNFTQYQVEHARLLSYLDALGINWNPAIVWNMIKWSFLVDWVIGVGRYLDTLKRANMEPQINIRRFLWSIKRERTIQVMKGTLLPLGAGTNYRSWNALPMIRETAYRRQTASLSRSSIELSGLSSKEFSLGAAIVIAQSRRSRR